MYGSGYVNVLAIRDSVIVKLSNMITKLTKKIEMVQEEMNHIKDMDKWPSQLMLLL